jgi:hypothetical protein
MLPDGSAEILDTRTLPEKRYRLSCSEALLYLFLDPIASDTKVVASFHEAHPAEAEEIDKHEGISALMDAWETLGLVLRDHGRVLALALNASRMAAGPRQLPNLQLPGS